jgi:energy-coupling factor transporter ATP-binding protein EcfA2
MAKKNDRDPAVAPQTAPTSPPPAQSVLDLILDWSASRPPWQRDALRRIVSKSALADADISELVTLCKKDNGRLGVALEAVPLDKAHLPSGPEGLSSVTLASIKDVIGVNQLATAQELAFAPDGVTIVYGDNGAGKSGYTRILKRVCKARHTGDIAANAFDNNAPPPSALLSYVTDGVPQQPLKWRNEDTPHPVLSAVNVFDRDSGIVHVREKNEVAFRPFGLDVPDELAAACQRVKDVLTKEQGDLERSRDAIFSKPSWKSTTAVGRILSALTAATPLGPLAKLAEVSEQEKHRYRQLVEDLAKDPMKAAAEHRLFADELRQLATQLDQVASRFSDQEMTNLNALADDARGKRQAALVAADNAFSNADLAGVGGAAWQALWSAARQYSEETAYPGRPFPLPSEDALCVLCHQQLSVTARLRLKGFDEFVRADTERQARAAEAAFTPARDRFIAQTVRVRDYVALRKRIALTDTSLARSILRFLASTRLRRRICLLALASKKPLLLPALALNPSKEVLELERRFRAYADELAKAAGEEGRKKLEAERDELADRISLEALYSKAEAEVARLAALALIAKCLPSTATTQITKLGNEIADQVITPRIRDRFQHEIVSLASNRVRVEIVRSGGKFGSPQYQIRFFANANVRVHTVLSEGEQTCVALAAFLTELATANHKSALVFDDPVSSLDHRWRKRVAQRLAEEAHQRQVIVFTHDLVFVHDLKDMAEATGTSTKLMTVARGPTGAGVITDGLPWRGTGIKDRIDKLQKEVREAQPFYDAHDEAEYRNRVFKIYNGLRSTWERAIEDIAFNGVIIRHREPLRLSRRLFRLSQAASRAGSSRLA